MKIKSTNSLSGSIIQSITDWEKLEIIIDDNKLDGIVEMTKG